MSRALKRAAGCAAAALGVAGAACMGGCLISSRSDEQMTGTQVSSATFNQIVPGETTRAWVLGALGEPTTRTTLDDGGELWKWSYSMRRTSRGSVLFVFGGSSATERAGSALVEMKDGVVTRAWRSDPGGDGR